MNPKEFSWTEDQQVTVSNPTGKDYNFKVHNKEYVVRSGETAKMPGYMAWLYVYGISSQICQEDGRFNRWNEEGFRDEYYNNIVVNTDELIARVEVEQPKVESLNQGEGDEESTQKEVRRGRPPKN